jgi:hypothetical protein
LKNALFISNKIFLDQSHAFKGGVTQCTQNYIDIIRKGYNLFFFPIDFDKSKYKRIKSRFCLGVFDDYNTKSYFGKLKDEIIQNEIKVIFINLSSAVDFSRIIKEINPLIKVVLCSHGIEAGDYFHNILRSGRGESKVAAAISNYKFGKIFKKDIQYRLKFIDLVLTVSEIEKSIEKWMGAKDVFFVPSLFKCEFLSWKPILGRLGFVGDVSHYPNYFGLESLCSEIAKEDIRNNIDIIIVGKPCSNIEILKSKYSFITSLGYLEEDLLKKEASTWMYYLNLVFYYSKGVSTKLQLGVNWGLPVLTTEPGNRGYNILLEKDLICNNPIEMVQVIKSRIENVELLYSDKKSIERNVKNQNEDYYSKIINEKLGNI